jgi:hypothetical protein
MANQMFTVVINFRDVEDVSLMEGRLIEIKTLTNKVMLADSCPDVDSSIAQ